MRASSNRKSSKNPNHRKKSCEGLITTTHCNEPFTECQVIAVRYLSSSIFINIELERYLTAITWHFVTYKSKFCKPLKFTVF